MSKYRVQPSLSLTGVSRQQTRTKEDDGLDLMARQKEKTRMDSSRKESQLEFGMDLLDVSVKLFVVAYYEGDFLPYLAVLFSISAGLAAFGAFNRVREILDMKHVVNKGYSKRWQKKSRIQTAAGEEDPRIARDRARRTFRHLRFRSIQAFVADLPWIILNIIRLSVELRSDAAIVSVLSICIAGFGFGVKFASFLAFMKAVLLTDQQQDRSDVFEVLPADVTIGVGSSTKVDTVAAIQEAYIMARSRLGNDPHFMIVTMTARHDHRAGLDKIAELAPNSVFCGGTTCQGVMVKDKSVRDDHHVVAVWALCDPDGHYETSIMTYNDSKNIELDSANAARRCRSRAKKHLEEKNILITPSFVWLTSAPGPEDRLLSGMMDYFGDTPLIGGSSADNDITGKWKQWCSQADGPPLMEDNGCSFAICYCSAIVQSQLFTGYSPTGKTGIATKTDGLRHILEIDNEPASQVYNRWTGGEFSDMLKDPVDSNILGPSSLYPLGQLCGEHEDGEAFYRSMHPHLLKKDTSSLTLFSDVSQGEEVIMMSGTKENVVNRIAGVASHVVRSGGFSLQEIRGSLIIFCAGCMMFASDQMDQAATKLSVALGGTPFLGMHTFGEQGQFSDGVSRHGNLMFSALVISSRRRTLKVLNVDTGKTLLETDPEFVEIIKSGKLKLS